MRYFDSLVKMFEQALKYVTALPETKRTPFLERLRAIRLQGRKIGWGVGEDMGSLLTEFGVDD